MHKKVRLRRRIRIALAAGVSGIGGTAVALLAPVGLVLAVLLALGVLVFLGAAIFSRREEPIQRLLELIKALWRNSGH
jgi:fumarate reductase subunit D